MIGESVDQDQFDRMAKKMEDITEHKDGGVFKKLVKPGTGSIVPQVITFGTFISKYKL